MWEGGSIFPPTLEFASNRLITKILIPGPGHNSFQKCDSKNVFSVFVITKVRVHTGCLERLSTWFLVNPMKNNNINGADVQKADRSKRDKKNKSLL